VQTRDRLLPRIATLRQADRTLDQARLGGKYAVVDLPAEGGCPGLDSQQLELVVRQLSRFRRRDTIDDLPCGPGVVRRRDEHTRRLFVGEQHKGVVTLDIDLDLGREPQTKEPALDGVAQLRLGEQQEVVLRPAEDAERRDHACLGSEQQRVARFPGPERLDVVRDDPLEKARGVGPAHADEAARAAGKRREGHVNHRR